MLRVAFVGTLLELGPLRQMGVVGTPPPQEIDRTSTITTDWRGAPDGHSPQLWAKMTSAIDPCSLMMVNTSRTSANGTSLT